MNIDKYMLDVIALVISGLGLIVSIIALIRDFCTRKKVQELVYGYIENDCFIIENSGEAPASNIRYEGWDDWSSNISHNMISYLPPHHNHSIELYLTMDSPNSGTFKITWDDEAGKDHVWSETLDL